MIFGIPNPADLFIYINKLAGKTTMSKATIPQAEILENIGMQTPIPKMISAIPDK